MITLSGNGLAKAVSGVVDRGNTSTPVAVTNTYTVPLNVPAGTYTVSIEFFTQEDGRGNIVANANGAATLSSTALSLGTYTTSATGVATVSVLAGQNVPVGSTLSLNAAAYDLSGGDLAVAPGGIFWSISGTPSSAMTLSQDGVVSATAVGSMSVTATVDGVTSAPQTISSYTVDPVTGCTNSTYLPNYATEMETATTVSGFHGVFTHWTSFPLTVQIVQNSYLTSDFSALAQQAMSAWEAATNGQVAFTPVTSGSSPDITITFEPSSLIDTSDQGVVGETFVYADSASVISRATIQVATDLGSDASTLNDITHELGHALGIGGHSNISQNLMYPYLNDSFAPANEDLNTLLTDYCGTFPQASPITRARRPSPTGSPIVIIDTRPK
jgi:hypothetical protein